MSFPEQILWLYQHQPAVLLALAMVFGLMIGSFLNVVIVRLPARLEQIDNDENEGGESAASAAGKWFLIVPPSHCPGCGHRLPWYENIPIASYLILGRKCSSCRAAISLRYPMVEALTGFLALAALWHFSLSVDSIIAFGLGCLFLVIACIDLDRLMIPDVLSLPAIWLGLAASAMGIGIVPKDAIIGAVCGYGVLALINSIYALLTQRQGIGRGDWKLAAVIGAWLGPQGLTISLMGAFLLGSLAGLVLMAAFAQGRRTAVPFGPFLAGGGVIAVYFGPDLAQWYMALIMPR
ncbi:MAG: A24 family peptidase [Alphaproteobacteria bacterium]|jgi:leader peptidase (prepilin peptidase)/N-methyltransferase|nr:A24 family peptidase [Alphaproteobacteria bacterium]MDP6831696.1 A24 family peptidase [Alphaproteobacteria bacterium]MDP6873377.1 A24 family peptidase [Alphaproteobacteria bacterium]